MSFKVFVFISSFTARFSVMRVFIASPHSCRLGQSYWGEVVSRGHTLVISGQFAQVYFLIIYPYSVALDTWTTCFCSNSSALFEGRTVTLAIPPVHPRHSVLSQGFISWGSSPFLVACYISFASGLRDVKKDVSP